MGIDSTMPPECVLGPCIAAALAVVFMLLKTDTGSLSTPSAPVKPVSKFPCVPANATLRCRSVPPRSGATSDAGRLVTRTWSAVPENEDDSILKTAPYGLHPRFFETGFNGDLMLSRTAQPGRIG